MVKSFLSFLMRLAVSGGLLWYVLAKYFTAETIVLVRSADFVYLLIAAGIFFVVNVLLMVRWYIFIRALDLAVTVGNMARHYFYGLFGNLFLPTAIGGDLIKIIGLCKDSAHKPKVVASVLIDRLSGFASIAIVAVAAYVFGYRYIEDKVLVVPILAIGGVVLAVAVVLLNERIYSFGCRLFSRLPRFQKGLMTMHYDMALLKEGHRTREGVKGVVVSCVSQAVFAFTYFYTAKALHQDIPVIYFLIFVPMICIASAFPSIGGLGVREVGAVYLFSRIGVESGVAASLSLINFLFMVVIGLIGGVIYVVTLSARRVQRYSSDAGGVGAGEA